jgi:stress response protein YsnF
VEKKPVVTGEVRVGKREVQETQNVSDEVRHEEVKVDKEGDVKVREEQEAGLKDKNKDKGKRIA